MRLLSDFRIWCELTFMYGVKVLVNIIQLSTTVMAQRVSAEKSWWWVWLQVMRVELRKPLVLDNLWFLSHFSFLISPHLLVQVTDVHFLNRVAGYLTLIFLTNLAPFEFEILIFKPLSLLGPFLIRLIDMINEVILFHLFLFFGQ